jgi:hypothetical protein
MTAAVLSTTTSSGSVLIGFADALAAPEVAASLMGGGLRVAGFTRRGRPVALQRLPGVELIEVTAPEDDLGACLEEVADASARFDVTMPLNDPAVLVCDRALPADAVVCGPRGDAAEFAVDKRLQLRAAKAAGLLVPEWTSLSAGGPTSDDLGWPLVVKPALAVEEVDGRIRRLSPRVVSDRAAVDRVWRDWGEATPVLAQRWLAGVGAGMFGMADPGGVHHLSAHRRVRMMNPSGSGSSACASARPSPALIAPIERFLDSVHWQGMFMIELLQSTEGVWFMELNGRPWGSLALSRRLGYEYPLWSVARALDQGAVLPEPPEFRELMCRNLGRELVHLAFVLRGQHSPIETWPGRWSTLRSLASAPRGSAWYNLAPGLSRLFLYDAWRTVADQTWAKGR